MRTRNRIIFVMFVTVLSPKGIEFNSKMGKRSRRKTFSEVITMERVNQFFRDFRLAYAQNFYDNLFAREDREEEEIDTELEEILREEEERDMLLFNHP